MPVCARSSVQIWQDTSVSSTAPVPTWLLAIGGVGIIAGERPLGWDTLQPGTTSG